MYEQITADVIDDDEPVLAIGVEEFQATRVAVVVDQLLLVGLLVGGVGLGLGLG